MSTESASLARAPDVRARILPLLRGAAEELVATIERRLHGSAAPHYAAAEPRLVHERVSRLVAAFVDGAGSGPETFVAHVRDVAEERIDEGYLLDEVQLALGALEERVWQLLVEHSQAEHLVPQLALVTAMVGAAKDELARVYLRHKGRAEVRAAELQRRLDELFKGTERPIESEPVRA